MKGNIHFFNTIVLLLVVMILCLFPSQSSAAQTEGLEKYPKIFRFGVLGVLPRVNHKDAQVVVEMNFVRRNRDRFPGIKAHLEIVSDIDSAAEMFRNQALHGISLSGVDFLRLKDRVELDPLFISSRQEKPLEAYVLLVPKRIASLKELAAVSERRLIVEKFGVHNVGQVWLDTVLREQGYSAGDSFFTSIKKVDKPARMVLPVFFGQAEAGLVPESAFQTMAELNPQIGQRLRVLMRSPEFVRSIHCTSPSLNDELVAAIKENAINMADNVDGRQLMMIFQFRSQHLFKPDYLRETERIYAKYKKLTDER